MNLMYLLINLWKEIPVSHYFSVCDTPNICTVSDLGLDSLTDAHLLSSSLLLLQLFHQLRGEQSNYCPEAVEKIWETVSRGRRPRSSPLPRDNGLTVPQVALKQLFYYPIVLNHRNTVNSTPMLAVDVDTFDVS